MNRRERESTWTVRGLRTRYRPRARIGHGLLSAAPWLDFALLVIMVAMLNGRAVLQPGVVVDLPRAPFRQGTRYGMVAVVLSVPQTGSQGRDAIVFFDDERFLMRDDTQMEKLKQTLERRARELGETYLVVQADRRVPHGSVMRLVSLADDAGLKRVNVATRPE
ncbi:MAG: ExbD/TolR family protein [Anaerolineae bacterium]